jgi:nitric oxide dioxygenase
MTLPPREDRHRVAHSTYVVISGDRNFLRVHLRTPPKTQALLRCVHHNAPATSRERIMNAHQVRLVQESFEKAAGLGEKVAEIFYAELFAIDPSLRAMFKGNMKEQHQKLLTTLALVIRSLHAPEKIIGAAQRLAVKHLDYGVEPQHYTYVGNALLRTLKKGLGAEFTPELRDAWVEAFRLLAKVMKEAAYGGATAQRGAA